MHRSPWILGLLLVLSAGCARRTQPPHADVAAPRPDAAASVPDVSPVPDVVAPEDVAGPTPPSSPASLGQPTNGGMGAPSGFEQFYAYQPPTYAAAGAPPALPIAPETLRADPGIAAGALPALGLDDAALARLSEHAFVVLAANPMFAMDDPVEAYQALEGSRLPIYVTVDTALHLYHLLFDGLLLKFETEALAPLLGRLLDALRQTALAAAGEPGLQGEAALRNLAVLDAARRLLDPAATVDDRVRQAVEAEAALVERREGPATSPVFGYEEDYTQYVPRGHYTRSVALERYFRAMLWLGRMAFLTRADDDPEPRGRVSRDEARRFAVQSLLLVQWLRETQVDGTAAMHAWSRIYRVTAFFAGFADDLTPTEIAAAAERAMGEAWSIDQLLEGDRLEAFRLQIVAQRVPKLFGGPPHEKRAPAVLPPPTAPLDAREQAAAADAGLRFFGLRYVPDAEVLSRLADPDVGPLRGDGTPFTLVHSSAGPVRGFARGLDVMAELGAPTARAHLRTLGDDAYDGFDQAFAAAAAVFPPAGDVRWRVNLYWSWMDVLRETVAPATPVTQAFQTTAAWQDRLLTAALASWAQLRHDTILYVKQPSAPTGAPVRIAPPPGFVDPYPEVFARLQALARLMNRALRDLRLVEDGSETGDLLIRFETLFTELLAVSVGEVENRAASAADREFLAGFAADCADLLDRLAELAPRPAENGLPAIDRRTTLAADVMTNPEAGEVLEEASGRLELLVAAVRIPGSTNIFVAAGPVLSYYELRQPMTARLTDETWRALLARPDAPAPPSWTCSYRSPCAAP
jgi:hypothetical protein